MILKDNYIFVSYFANLVLHLLHILTMVYNKTLYTYTVLFQIKCESTP